MHFFLVLVLELGPFHIACWSGLAIVAEMCVCCITGVSEVGEDTILFDVGVGMNIFLSAFLNGAVIVAEVGIFCITGVSEVGK